VAIVILVGWGLGIIIFWVTDLPNLMPVTGQKSPLAGEKIVVDPGHGGIDGGSSYGELLEKEINLTLAQKLEDYFTDRKVKTVLTRSKDQALDHLNSKYKSRHRRDLQARVDIIEAETPEFFISLHVNYFSGQSKLRGPICFYQAEKEKSKQLAQAIQNQLNQLTEQGKQLPDNSIRPGDYFLLNNCQVPGVLIEMGFLNQPTDRKLLTNKKFQKKLVQAIYQGSLNFQQADQSSE